MDILTKVNVKHVTCDAQGRPNGYLVPIYNVNEHFFPEGLEPKQVYLTTIAPRAIKGPHLHYIRTGCFTCIRGNARFILKVNGVYQAIYSGENYQYRSVIVPKGVPAALQNLGDDDAFVLNMPVPAWAPNMHDEHTADFSDFNFTEIAEP